MLVQGQSDRTVCVSKERIKDWEPWTSDDGRSSQRLMAVAKLGGFLSCMLITAGIILELAGKTWPMSQSEVSLGSWYASSLVLRSMATASARSAKTGAYLFKPSAQSAVGKT